MGIHVSDVHTRQRSPKKKAPKRHWREVLKNGRPLGLEYRSALRKKEAYMIYQRNWRKHNPKYQAKWKQKNPDYQAEWRQKNPDYQAEWKQKNPDYRADWRRKNPKYMSEYIMRRYHTDPAFRMLKIMRSRIYAALKAHGAAKRSRTVEYIGCTPDELRAHLEKQFTGDMSWSNHGQLWHVDHIRPCASYDHTDDAQVRKCHHYSNLQPMLGPENLSKGSMWEGQRWNASDHQ